MRRIYPTDLSDKVRACLKTYFPVAKSYWAGCECKVCETTPGWCLVAVREGGETKLESQGYADATDRYEIAITGGSNNVAVGNR